jgi:hypothetical protein
MTEGFQATLEFFDENAHRHSSVNGVDNATRQGNVKR